VKTHTKYLTFNTRARRELVRITNDVGDAIRDSGVQEGLVLVSAMHITAAIIVNDDEPGLHRDIWEWLQELAQALSDHHHQTGDTAGAASQHSDPHQTLLPTRQRH
jgi:thiamine phosphate synthase YjbQ (UPF0047 family)